MNGYTNTATITLDVEEIQKIYSALDDFFVNHPLPREEQDKRRADYPVLFELYLLTKMIHITKFKPIIHS